MTKSRAKPASRKAVTPIARRLREERLRLGLSQQQLGEAIGLDPGGAGVRINQYEQGVHTPNFAFIKQIADVAGVDACYFYAEDNRVAELIRGFDKSSI